MPSLRSATINLASSLPEGSPLKQELLAALQEGPVSEGQKLADLIKKKWKNSKWDQKQGRGTADIGALKITWRESSNDNAVIVTVVDLPFMKSDAENMHDFLEKMYATFRML